MQYRVLMVMLVMVCLLGAAFLVLLLVRSHSQQPASSLPGTVGVRGGTSTASQDPVCPKRLLDSDNVREVLTRRAFTLEEALAKPDNTCILILSLSHLRFLPPTIGRLPHLLFLNVAGNDLTELPPEIGELKNLSVLNLKENRLTQLPWEMCNLTNLETLSLGENHLRHIPACFVNLKKLKHLYLQDNEFSDGEIAKMKTMFPTGVVEL